jgi:hypothetical protein
MDLQVLPGPSLAEQARTALARAGSATVSQAGPGGEAGPVQAPIRAGPAGSPVILPGIGSALARQLTACPQPVAVSLPAPVPFSALRLTGAARPARRDRAARITAFAVEVQSVEFSGASPARVPLAEYRAAAPDPLWRQAPAVLHHLEHGHMTDLIRCVRAHGMIQADWVIPRGLDRYGLELLVLTADRLAAVRLSFPDGPVTSLRGVPASIRGVLTCRCRSAGGRHNGALP